MAGFRAGPQSSLPSLDCEVEGVDDAWRAARSRGAAATPWSWHCGLEASSLAAVYKVAVSQLFLWCWLESFQQSSPFLPPSYFPLTSLFLPTPSRPSCVRAFICVAAQLEITTLSDAM